MQEVSTYLYVNYHITLILTLTDILQKSWDQLSGTVFLLKLGNNQMCIWGKVFNSRLSEVCGKRPLKNLKVLKQKISLEFF